MHYVSAENLGISYGVEPLFTNISFHIEEGDRIALVAKNGTGKSTLLKMLAGREKADEGKLWIHKDVSVILFEQESDFAEEATILQNIFHLDHPVLNAIKVLKAATENGDVSQVNDAVSKMDTLNAWNFEAKIKQILSKLNIDQLHRPVKNLSGGQKKRIALAKTLIDIGFESQHVLLLMDEPTNHLDVAMVEWLEEYFEKENITLILVTHDRYFLDATCTEIWELEDGQLYFHKGDYQTYLQNKSIRIENTNASIDKAKNLYRKELEWMRKQPRARTTKSKSRQDNFYTIEKKAKTQIAEQQLQLDVKMNRLGGKIIELKKVYKNFGDKIILKGFDYTFKKGEKIGIIGKNGTGKSTFLNIIQGIEKADSGKINVGDTVVFGHYTQEGMIIKNDCRVIEYVKNIAEHFPLSKGGSLSAAQFLQLFLFEPDKQYTYISKLSGGEKRRLHLLSILFRNPNFLILDEPTNDLDLPTLSVLENFLSEFPGCVLIVSHDRYFMDRLIEHLFVFEGDGIIKDFPGNYSLYRTSLENANTTKEESEKVKKEIPELSKKKKREFGFKEKREFEQLEIEIEKLNREKEIITAELNSGTTDFEELQKLSIRISEISKILDEKEYRWLELSELQS